MKGNQWDSDLILFFCKLSLCFNLIFKAFSTRVPTAAVYLHRENSVNLVYGSTGHCTNSTMSILMLLCIVHILTSRLSCPEAITSYCTSLLLCSSYYLTESSPPSILSLDVLTLFPSVGHRRWWRSKVWPPPPPSTSYRVQKCRFRCWGSRTCMGGPVGPAWTGPWEDLSPWRGGSGVDRM